MKTVILELLDLGTFIALLYVVHLQGRRIEALEEANSKTCGKPRKCG